MNSILIIEDDAQTRENLGLILEMEGFRVQTAADGLTGVRLAGELKPDLIVSDVTMPRMDGHAVLASVRAMPGLETVPFVFLTARTERHDLREGMNLGADDYLCKPLDAADLLACIRARLERHRVHVQAGLQPEETVPDFSAAAPLERLGLTPREAEVLLWVAQGKGNAEVGAILGMSEKTAKIHLAHIFHKLGVETRTAAALVAIETLPRSRRSESGGVSRGT